MGLTLLAATMCASVQPLSAAPSERIRINITLANGSQLEVTRMGDEHFTYYMTDAGETIVRDSLGYRLVEDDEEWQALLSEANGRRKAVRRKVGSAAGAPLGQHGVKRVPVVLVSFADKGFAVGEDAEAVNRYYHLYCNGNADGSPYTGHGSKGSLREYFTEQSRGESRQTRQGIRLLRRQLGRRKAQGHQL